MRENFTYGSEWRVMETGRKQPRHHSTRPLRFVDRNGLEVTESNEIQKYLTYRDVSKILNSFSNPLSIIGIGGGILNEKASGVLLQKPFSNGIFDIGSLGKNTSNYMGWAGIFIIGCSLALTTDPYVIVDSSQRNLFIEEATIALEKYDKDIAILTENGGSEESILVLQQYRQQLFIERQANIQQNERDAQYAKSQEKWANEYAKYYSDGNGNWRHN